MSPSHLGTLSLHPAITHERSLDEDGAGPHVAIRNPGEYHYRGGSTVAPGDLFPHSESHYNNPNTMTALQIAARTNSRAAYEQYSRVTDEANAEVTLRGILTFRDPEQLGLAPIVGFSRFLGLRRLGTSLLGTQGTKLTPFPPPVPPAHPT